MDLIGHKIGLLTVIASVNTKQSLWLCKCTCGKEITVRTNTIINNKIQSCGCLFKDAIKSTNSRPLNVIAEQAIYNTIKNSAKHRNIPFYLNKDEIIKLIHKPCYYCGSIDINIYRHKTTGEEYRYNGIDRVDSFKAYSIDNVVPCCIKCNISKQQMTMVEYIDHCEKVIKHICKYQNISQ